MQIVVACYIDYGISTVMRKGVERFTVTVRSLLSVLTETPFHYRTLPVQYTLSGGFPPEILDFSIDTCCQSLHYISSAVCAQRLERLLCTRRPPTCMISTEIHVPPTSFSLARHPRYHPYVCTLPVVPALLALSV